MSQALSDQLKIEKNGTHWVFKRSNTSSIFTIGPELQKVLTRAQTEAQSKKLDEVGAEQLLHTAFTKGDGEKAPPLAFSKFVPPGLQKKGGKHQTKLVSAVDGKKGKNKLTTPPPFSPRVCLWLSTVAKPGEPIKLTQVIKEILNHPSPELRDLLQKQKFEVKKGKFVRIKKAAASAASMAKTAISSEHPLCKFGGVELTSAAVAKKLPTLVGQHATLEYVRAVLCSDVKRNVLVTAPPGAGKTAVVEGLAKAISEGGASLPPDLKGKRIVSIPASAFTSGTTLRGEMEERVEEILKIAKEDPNTILFIDEFHTFVGTGKSGAGGADVANAFKPAMARGQICVIGATTNDEAIIVEADGALMRRLRAARLPQTTPEGAIPILEKKREGLAKRMGYSVDEADTAIPNHTLVKAVEFGQRYLTTALPDCAFDLLDIATGLVQDMPHTVGERGELLIVNALVQWALDQAMANESDGQRQRDLKARKGRLGMLAKEHQAAIAYLIGTEQLDLVKQAIEKMQPQLRDGLRQFTEAYHTKLDEVPTLSDAHVTLINQCLNGKSTWTEIVKELRKSGGHFTDDTVKRLEDVVTALRELSADLAAAIGEPDRFVLSAEGLELTLKRWKDDPVAKALGGGESLWNKLKVLQPDQKPTKAKAGPLQKECSQVRTKVEGLLTALFPVTESTRKALDAVDQELMRYLLKMTGMRADLIGEIDEAWDESGTGKAVWNFALQNYQYACSTAAVEQRVDTPDELVERKLTLFGDDVVTKLAKIIPSDESKAALVALAKEVAKTLFSCIKDDRGIYFTLLKDTLSELKDTVGGMVEAATKGLSPEDLGALTDPAKGGQLLMKVLGNLAQALGRFGQGLFNVSARTLKDEALRGAFANVLSHEGEVLLASLREQAETNTLVFELVSQLTGSLFQGSNRTKLEAMGCMLPPSVVEPHHLAIAVEHLSNIKPEFVQQGQEERLTAFAAALCKDERGQPMAITTLLEAIRRNLTDFRDPRKPLETLLLAGPPGTGKTLLARLCALHLFGSEDNMTKISMEQYADPTSANTLKGAGTGYEGSWMGGVLTESVRRNPYQVILFDELEKGNPLVIQMILDLLESGEMTDGRGRKINFRNCLIIMTSNAGEDIIAKHGQHLLGQSRYRLKRAQRRALEGYLQKYKALASLSQDQRDALRLLCEFVSYGLQPPAPEIAAFTSHAAIIEEVAPHLYDDLKAYVEGDTTQPASDKVVKGCEHLEEVLRAQMLSLDNLQEYSGKPDPEIIAGSESKKESRRGELLRFTHELSHLIALQCDSHEDATHLAKRARTILENNLKPELKDEDKGKIKSALRGEYAPKPCRAQGGPPTAPTSEAGTDGDGEAQPPLAPQIAAVSQLAAPLHQLQEVMALVTQLGQPLAELQAAASGSAEDAATKLQEVLPQLLALAVHCSQPAAPLSALPDLSALLTPLVEGLTSFVHQLTSSGTSSATSTSGAIHSLGQQIESMQKLSAMATAHRVPPEMIFTRAFLRRITAVPFFPFDKETLREVAEAELDKWQRQMEETKGVTFALTDEGKDALLTQAVKDVKGRENEGAQAINDFFNKKMNGALAALALHYTLTPSDRLKVVVDPVTGRPVFILEALESRMGKWIEKQPYTRTLPSFRLDDRVKQLLLLQAHQHGIKEDKLDTWLKDKVKGLLKDPDPACCYHISFDEETGCPKVEPAYDAIFAAMGLELAGQTDFTEKVRLNGKTAVEEARARKALEREARSAVYSTLAHWQTLEQSRVRTNLLPLDGVFYHQFLSADACAFTRLDGQSVVPVQISLTDRARQWLARQPSKPNLYQLLSSVIQESDASRGNGDGMEIDIKVGRGGISLTSIAKEIS